MGASLHSSGLRRMIAAMTGLDHPAGAVMIEGRTAWQAWPGLGPLRGGALRGPA